MTQCEDQVDGLTDEQVCAVGWIDSLTDYELGEVVADNVLARPEGGVTVRAARIRNALRELAQNSNRKAKA